MYAGIEVSITANDDDVNRAADRVEILGRVTGGPALTAVIAAWLEAPQIELAAKRGCSSSPSRIGAWRHGHQRDLRQVAEAQSYNRAQVSAEAGLPPSL